MSQETVALARPRPDEPRSLVFDPAGYPMRTVTVAAVLALVAIALLVIGTTVTLALGGGLAALAVHTAREAVDRFTHDRRAPRRG